MLKKVTFLLALVLCTASISHAQWTNQGVFPNATSVFSKGQNHAMAVDPAGNIWVGRYAAFAKFGVAPGDTLKKSVYLIYVFKPDGTQMSFSPIWKILGDTLLTTNRGMRINIDGNILMLTGNTPTPNYLYKIDYKTGLGIKKVQLKYTAAAPAVSSTGTIFVAPVVPGLTAPMEMYDQNLTLIGNALPTTVGFSRSFEVSKDGNTIYWAGYTNHKIYIYTRADEFSSFARKDSLFEGFDCESFTWHPKTGNLWMSAGSNNDKPKAPYTMGSWYAYDFATKKVVDSLKWKYADPLKPDERPRALAFSPDGKIAYIGSFGTATSDILQKVVQGPVSVKEIAELPVGYELSQNYPNPFNPTTNIKFSIPEQGFVSLKVYNTLGQEVATLLNEFKSAGTYQVDFDASKLSSGVYMYTLNSGKFIISKKMLLMK
jgi:sugar lactone lactonase YvrE